MRQDTEKMRINPNSKNRYENCLENDAQQAFDAERLLKREQIVGIMTPKCTFCDRNYRIYMAILTSLQS